jgi:hypothetical protein
MSRKTNLAKNQPPPVHVQIIRRVIPAIVVAFVIFTALMVYVFYSSTRTQLNQIHEVELGERTTEINDLIAKAVSDAQTVANLPGTRTFADSSLKALAEASGAKPNGQDELLSRFLELLNTNKGAYSGVRFVLKTGSVWSEVVDRNGVPTTFSGYQSGILAGDSTVLNSLKDAKNVTLSPITIKSTALGAPIVIMRFFAPVVSATNAANQDVLGVIELDLSATNIL